MKKHNFLILANVVFTLACVSSAQILAQSAPASATITFTTKKNGNAPEPPTVTNGDVISGELKDGLVTNATAQEYEVHTELAIYTDVGRIRKRVTDQGELPPNGTYTIPTMSASWNGFIWDALNNPSCTYAVVCYSIKVIRYDANGDPEVFTIKSGNFHFTGVPPG